MGILTNLILILYLTGGQCLGAIRLEELRESYLEAYPKRQYISPNFTKGAPNVNVRKFDSIWRRCQEPSQFSSRQFQRLKKHYGEDVLLNVTIENMLYQPRATMFNEHKNYWRKAQFEEEYHIALAGSDGCFNLKVRKSGLVKTYGKCIRVFKYSNCYGWTLAIYPGSKIPHEKLENIKFTQIRSIGPCFPDEFLSSSLAPDKAEVIKKTLLKVNNPDLIDLPLGSETYHYDGLTSMDTRSNKSFYVMYKLDLKKRIEDVHVKIVKKNFDERQASKFSMSNERFRQNETEEGDVLIYVIPPEVGGPTNQSWNVFLGNRPTAEFWANMLSNLVSPANDSEILDFHFNFIYEDENEIKPLFFYYSARAEGLTSYGRVFNGFHNKLRTTQIDEHLNETKVKTFKEEERKDEAGKAFFRRLNRLEILLKSDEISRNGSSNIRNLNHIENQVRNFSVKTRQFLSRFQENYLTTNSETMKAHSAALHRMVETPLARFYSGVDYTGDFEDYNPHNPLFEVRVCHDLENLENRVKSIATFGTCIRVFIIPHCMGQSLVFYGDSNKNTSLSQIILHFNLSDIQSIGPCLWGELSQSYFMPNGIFVPKTIFPHFITFAHLGKARDAEEVSDGSILRHTPGSQNRTEFIYAEIYPKNILDLISLQRGRFPMGFENEEGKLLCFTVPPILNGPTNQSYNIFEASQDAIEDWKEVMEHFHVLKRGKSLLFVHFLYDDIISTRPTWIYFYILHLVRRTVRGISYGQVYNGLKGNSSNYPRGKWHSRKFFDDYIRFSF